MTNIDRAAEIIRLAMLARTFRSPELRALTAARALRHAGLLMPDGMSTLTVGSEWDDAAALTRACDESQRDQIVALDADGDAFVWSHGAEWWEGSAPPLVAPYTIIHTGKKAADAVD